MRHEGGDAVGAHGERDEDAEAEPEHLVEEVDRQQPGHALLVLARHVARIERGQVVDVELLLRVNARHRLRRGEAEQPLPPADLLRGADEQRQREQQVKSVAALAPGEEERRGGSQEEHHREPLEHAVLATERDRAGNVEREIGAVGEDECGRAQGEVAAQREGFGEERGQEVTQGTRAVAGE